MKYTTDIVDPTIPRSDALLISLLTEFLKDVWSLEVVPSDSCVGMNLINFIK